MTKPSAIRCNTPGWEAKPIPQAGSRRGSAETDALVQQLIAGNHLILHQSVKLTPPTRRSSDTSNVRISIDQDEDAVVVLMVW
jgi:hypothetical protein